MKRIIIDTDTASDDAVAIIYALRRRDVRVEAITVTAGNLPLDLCMHNALISVEMAGTYTPPVFPGARSPLLRPLFTSEFVHGNDGMGDMNLPPARIKPQTKHAVEAMIGLARANPGEIDIITLGPLTNLALAARLEPDLPRLIRSVWCMAGQGYGPGNVSPTAEFNLYVDAEAAQIVLDSGMKPVFVGWDTSTDETFLDEKDMARLEKGSGLARFVLRCNQGLIEHNRKDWGKTGFDLPDPVTMLAALHPELVTRKHQAWCAIGIKAEETYGQLVIDRGNVLKRPPNATIVLAIDARRFKELLFETLTG